jgi:uncharacterized protein
MPWFVTVAILVLLDLPFAGFLVRGSGFAADAEREVLYWAAVLLLLAYIRFVEKRPLSSVGLRRPVWQTPVFGVLAGVVAIAGIVGIYLVVFPALHLTMNEGMRTAIKASPLWFQLTIVARAAVFEELFYRGFAIERITELTGMRWLAALISLAAFTYAHLAYWGWAHLLIAAYGGAVLTALYLWRRDLASNMIAHFVTDAVLFFLT